MSRLLKSWAMPPASWPIASIFWDWRSCSSSWLALGDVGDRALDDDLAGALVGEQRGVLEASRRGPRPCALRASRVGEAARLRSRASKKSLRCRRRGRGRPCPGRPGPPARRSRRCARARRCTRGCARRASCGRRRPGCARRGAGTVPPTRASASCARLRSSATAICCETKVRTSFSWPPEREARVVALDDEHAEGLPAALQRHAEPATEFEPTELDLAPSRASPKSPRRARAAPRRCAGRAPSGRCRAASARAWDRPRRRSTGRRSGLVCGSCRAT